MPDKRTHRGAHPQDAELFDRSNWDRLRAAVADLSWLLSRHYSETSALKLVGDRFALTERQRIAVRRCACSEEALQRRRQHQVPAAQVQDRTLLLDGYNVLTTVEAALAGGVLLAARDGAYRDMASVHGTFRRVTETVPGLELLGRMSCDLGARQCIWYLDRPVSNSGRLAAMIRDVATAHGWDWQVQLVPNPDRVLRDSEHLIATADSGILDACRHWINLARETVTTLVPDAYVVDLSF